LCFSQVTEALALLKHFITVLFISQFFTCHFLDLQLLVVSNLGFVPESLKIVFKQVQLTFIQDLSNSKIRAFIIQSFILLQNALLSVSLNDITFIFEQEQ